MVNPHRGEIEAVLGGVPYTLCLTLGALAELGARLWRGRHAGAGGAVPDRPDQRG